MSSPAWRRRWCSPPPVAGTGGRTWRRAPNRHWYLADAPAGDPETGAGDVPPDDWPVAQQTIFGLVTLAADDRIEYSTPSGDVIAVYTPSDREPPGCD